MKATFKKVNFENKDNFSMDWEYTNVKSFNQVLARLQTNLKKYGIDMVDFISSKGCDLSLDCDNIIVDNFDYKEETYDYIYKYVKGVEIHCYFYDKQFGTKFNFVIEYDESFNFAYVCIMFNEKEEWKTYKSTIEETNIEIENRDFHNEKYVLSDIINNVSINTYIKDFFNHHFYTHYQENVIENNDMYHLEIEYKSDNDLHVYFCDKINHISIMFFISDNHYYFNSITANSNKYDVLITLPYKIKIA